MPRLRPFSDHQRGLFISIDGPSGAGKSTLVSHLAQMLVAGRPPGPCLGFARLRGHSIVRPAARDGARPDGDPRSGQPKPEVRSRAKTSVTTARARAAARR